MSARDGENGATSADRIEAVRRATPPPEERKARKDYISKDDFAALVGASRSRVYDWIKGTAFPEERFRRRLAELSLGRFEPDDFANPDRSGSGARKAERRLEPRIEALEAAVARIEAQLSDEAEAQEQ